MAVCNAVYIPYFNTFYFDALTLASLTAAFAGLNVTLPGPLTLLHETESVLPCGNPSSVTLPLSAAEAGNSIVCA